MLAKWVSVLQPYFNYPITYIRVVQIFHYADFSEELGGDVIVTYVRLSSRKLTEIKLGYYWEIENDDGSQYTIHFIEVYEHVIGVVHVYMHVHVKGYSCLQLLCSSRKSSEKVVHVHVGQVK